MVPSPLFSPLFYKKSDLVIRSAMLRTTKAVFPRALKPLPPLVVPVSSRSYIPSLPLCQDNAAAPVAKEFKRAAALDYNNRRAAYNRQVSLLRKQYADEVARQRAADLAEEEAIRRELTRRRLERQRRKNMRSAQNALRQEELRQQRAKEFEEHLRVMQLQRDAKNERYTMARQLVIDELEEESPLWLTTHEEVDAAFTHEAQQLLWSRPGGVLGAPNPSLDSHFWQFETHTARMSKIYKSMRQVLLEEMEEAVYYESNVDPNFWTDERLAEQERLEDKAKLRAMVHSAGRVALLKKQREMLEDVAKIEDGDIPKPLPVPSLNVLKNDRAMEREGVKILFENPTKFFEFDNAVQNDAAESEMSAYAGPTLGSPIGLRDVLREHSHQGRVFPLIVGKEPKPDTRTEREKKRQERERRMWAAAQAEAHDESLDVELASRQQTIEDLQPDLNYNELDYDSDDEEWVKGLDPIADADIINVPKERRYKEKDIDWVSEQLQAQVKHYEQQLAQDVERLKYGFRSVALDKDTLEAALFALPSESLLALSDLDERYVEGLSDEELQAASKSIPGLSEEQVLAVLKRDRGATNSK